MKLYKYTGTISEVSFRNRTACDIKLYDMNDRDKAPHPAGGFRRPRKIHLGYRGHRCRRAVHQE